MQPSASPATSAPVDAASLPGAPAVMATTSVAESESTPTSLVTPQPTSALDILQPRKHTTPSQGSLLTADINCTLPKMSISQV